MKPRDITLSSSLIGIYIAIIVICAATSLKVGAIMYSALFGIFWPFFTTKQNLGFQVGRIAWNMLLSVKAIPKIVALIRGQSFAGVVFLDLHNNTQPGIALTKGYQLLEALMRAQPVTAVYVFVLIYVSVNCLIWPYAFYRYFKMKKVFDRLPEY